MTSREKKSKGSGTEIVLITRDCCLPLDSLISERLERLLGITWYSYAMLLLARTACLIRNHQSFKHVQKKFYVAGIEWGPANITMMMNHQPPLQKKDNYKESEV